MKERPILFSAPMVLALLAGTKTQTRRVVKSMGELRYPEDVDLWSDEGGGIWKFGCCVSGSMASLGEVRCPYGEPGDRLWVRETWADSDAENCLWEYRADNHDPKALKWRPSIFMPRKASRITLEITEVRVERLQSISEADAKAEGVALDRPKERWRDEVWPTARERYEDLWNEINGRNAWSANPWVWALTFKRVMP